MKQRMALLCVILILFIPTQTSGHAYRGRQDEGSALYVVTGEIAGVPSSVIVVSELPNNSAARDWEVAVIFQPSDPELGYWVKIKDSHMALDKAEPTDDVLRGAGNVIGSAVFGPWVVYPADPDWGPLIWDIYALSLDGKETYIHFIMSWQFGENAPLEIQLPGEDNGFTGNYTFGHILEFGFAIFLGTFTAHKKSKEHQIKESKYEVKTD